MFCSTMRTSYCAYDYMLRKMYQRAAKVGRQTTRFALASKQLLVCSCFSSLGPASWGKPANYRLSGEDKLKAPPAPPVIVCAPGLEYLACLDQIIIRQLLQVGFSCERRNRYVATNSMGQIIYNMAEYSERCARFHYGQVRSFEMDVLDYRNAVVMHFVRPLRCMRPCCGCRGQVLSTNGVVIGKITKLWGGALKEVFTTADNYAVTFPLDLDVHIKGALIAATILIDYMFFEA
ncbi:phospholipid scramblase 2-like isoform X4 [Dermacentor albipictus]|uniref:phospholipid scramblase 2-like isoform X4 n=1 Tax=Dermacentor albipictus TaxID=60249 RepID=UPI0031FCB0F5